MEGDGKIPMLLAFYFGEAAEAAWQGASERLLGWRQAYEEWRMERKRTYRPDTVKQPWELTQPPPFGDLLARLSRQMVELWRSIKIPFLHFR